MKTTIISIIIFLILLLGGSYLLKDKNIPILSMLGQDVSKLVFNEFDTYPEFENIQSVDTGTLIKTETNTDDIYTSQDMKLAAGFYKTEIPADAKCNIGVNNTYIVCTSLNELMDYFRNVPVNPEELRYKNYASVEYYPFPSNLINKIPNRFGSKSSGGSQGNYKELKRNLLNKDVGYFNVNFEEKNTIETPLVEVDVNQEIELSLKKISVFVQKAEFILDKVNHIKTLDKPEEINLTEEDYNTFVSNYEYIINNISSITSLNINDTDLKKIQDAASSAPVVISLLENRNSVEIDKNSMSDIPFCSDNVLITGQDFINNLNSCSNYECQYKHPFFADETMIRKIQNQGINCSYTEEMPNNGLMTCTFSEEKRLAAANYYQKISDGAEVSTKVNITFNNEGSETEVSEEIDGEASELTLNDFLADGTCIVTGYDN